MASSSRVQAALCQFLIGNDTARLICKTAVLKQQQTGPSDEKQDNALEIQEVNAELDRLREYLKRALAIDPINQEFPPTVQQAIEALNSATLDLGRTEVTSPVDGIVTNFHLTPGAFAKPGIPVASIIDTTQWRLVAAVPENWLEKIRPADCHQIPDEHARVLATFCRRGTKFPACRRGFAKRVYDV